MFNKSRKYKIVKKDYSDVTSDYTDTTNNNTTDTSQTYRFTSLTPTYKKPPEGSKQDNLTKEEIMDKLKGYKALRTMQDKRYLLTLPPFKVWIKYFNTETKEFRIGGLLKLVDSQLRYIMLVNTSQNLTWSVQLKDNIIFIPKDIEEKQQEKEREKIEKDKEDAIKNKLYKLYQQGKLTKR